MGTIYQAIPATPEDVEQYAGEIPSEYLHCRVWHHDPTPHNIILASPEDKKKAADAVWSAELTCTHNCGIRWRVLVSRDGEVISRRLDYSGAPDYVLRGKGRIDKHGNQILRRTFFEKTGPKTKTRRTR